MSAGPIIAPSARSTASARRTSFTPIENPLRVWDLGEGFTMMIGPNRAAIILEVGHVEGAEAVVIVHAMLARKKFLR